MIVSAPVNFKISTKPWSVALDRDLSTDVSYSSPFINRAKNDLVRGLQSGYGLGSIIGHYRREFVKSKLGMGSTWFDIHPDAWFDPNTCVANLNHPGNMTPDQFSAFQACTPISTTINRPTDGGGALIPQLNNPVMIMSNVPAGDATAQQISPQASNTQNTTNTTSQTTNPTSLVGGGINVSGAQSANSNVGTPGDMTGGGSSISSTVSDVGTGIVNWFQALSPMEIGLGIGGLVLLYWFMNKGGGNDGLVSFTSHRRRVK